MPQSPAAILPGKHTLSSSFVAQDSLGLVLTVGHKSPFGRQSIT